MEKGMNWRIVTGSCKWLWNYGLKFALVQFFFSLYLLMDKKLILQLLPWEQKPKHYFWMKDTFSSVSKGSESSKTQQLEYDLEEIIGVQTSDFEIHPSHGLDHSPGVIHSSEVLLSCCLVNTPWPLSRNLCKSFTFAVLTGFLREQWPATCTPCNLSVM